MPNVSADRRGMCCWQGTGSEVCKVPIHQWKSMWPPTCLALHALPTGQHPNQHHLAVLSASQCRSAAETRLLLPDTWSTHAAAAVLLLDNCRSHLAGSNTHDPAVSSAPCTCQQLQGKQQHRTYTVLLTSSSCLQHKPLHTSAGQLPIAGGKPFPDVHSWRNCCSVLLCKIDAHSQLGRSLLCC